MSQYCTGVVFNMQESKESLTDHPENKQTATSPKIPKMDVAFVIDLQNPIHLNQRKKAWEDVKDACNSLNANCHQVQFEKLYLGEADELEVMYNADVALVNLSVDTQDNTLFYHLGVRESFGMKHNVLTYNEYDTEIKTPFKLSWTNYPIVRYRSLECGSCVVTMEPGAQETLEETRIPLSHRIKRLLEDVKIQSKAHIKEKFLADLQKARDTLSDDKLCKALHDLIKRLDDPNLISEEVVYNLLVSFREIQDYDAILNLVKTLEIISYNNITGNPKILYLSAFALSRRNKDGDREKALQIITKAVEETENQVSDFFGLGGRIYKDKFVESNYKDKDSLEQAIHWYRKGFKVQPNEHTGINLASLLVVSGQEFSDNEELQHIGMLLNNLIGKKGSLSTLQDYWDVATFFEISVLAKDYGKANQAAECMFRLKPPNWNLKSTMGNLKLIKQFKKQEDVQESPEEFLFGFWTEYLQEAIKSEAQLTTRIPVLILEPSCVFKASYVTLNLGSDGQELKSLHIINVCFDCVNSRCTRRHDWVFTADSINLSFYQKDDRCAFLHVLQNSEDFHIYLPNSQYRERFSNLVPPLQQNKRASSKIINAALSQTGTEKVEDEP